MADRSTRKPFTLTDFAALIGGSIGMVYLVGYLVLASHQRALGISVRSTDAPVLIGNAWEFAYRGMLITFITVVRWVTGLTNWRVIAALLFATAMLAFVTRRTGGIAAILRRRRPVSPSVVATVVIALGIADLAFYTIPITGIQELLFSPAQVAPFGNLPEWLNSRLTRRVATLQAALIDPNAPRRSDPDRRAGILTSHVLLALASLAAYRFLRRSLPRTRRVRVLTGIVLALTISLCFFAPIVYGVLLKSYRYPRTRITIAPTADPQTNLLYQDYPYKLPFLLDSSDTDIYLYFPDDKQIAVVRRETLAQFRIIGSDFVLGVH